MCSNECKKLYNQKAKRFLEFSNNLLWVVGLSRVDALVHGTRLGLYDLVARVSVCIAFIAWSLLQAEGGAWLV